MTFRKPNRRDVLRASLGLGAGLALPNWFIEETMAADEAVKPVKAANDRPRVLWIGCGGRGNSVSREVKPFGDIVAVCDVDSKHAANAIAEFPKAESFSDFRKAMDETKFDIVLNATPDHWHTLINIASARRGKDIYSEKPLTLTIDEGKHLIKEIRGNKRILQTGSQQRSDAKFRLACELVRNGRLGKMKHVDVVLPAGRTDGPLATKPVPENLDWNFWQGQTKATDYVPERCHQWFRFWLDYSGGTNTDWGAHHNDIALWALNEIAPVEIEGKKLSTNVPGGFTTPGDYEVKFTYASGVTQTVRSHPNYMWNGSRKPGAPPYAKPDAGKPPHDTHGVTFHGSDGWLFITRGKIEASNPDILKYEFPASAERLYVSTNHAANFFDSVKSRKDSICPVEVGHRSASACHLAVIGTLLGRKLKWDPQAEQFVGDDEANKMLSREMRKPWGYDAV
ncbi:Gfo/Idh/MocA family protein [Humisphaera borealis]|uniref:Gfo/Idh/MocA family oxidoreductase n=1 Tax=Humisphaera borealis TaxID=2807512 RepID=A0A7M2WYF1_9BACT|nr:Gfo/Idh/MocA family oxidoreductase [Humisphaera borealis]QOV90495.1 Gfo/Idh/MocA family oxidoreductase [Humisphaera borealis]